MCCFGVLESCVTFQQSVKTKMSSAPMQRSRKIEIVTIKETAQCVHAQEEGKEDGKIRVTMWGDVTSALAALHDHMK